MFAERVFKKRISRTIIGTHAVQQASNIRG